jgi:uncharacterized protein YbjT (DUF2867 family)
MSASTTCLVVGATGLVGAAAAHCLRELGGEVRAFVRGDHDRPTVRSLSQAGVRVIAGDLRDRAAIATACADVHTVVCTATSMPNAGGDALQAVDHDGVLALIEAAEEAGARRFVYVSFSGNIQTDSPLASAKRACEARLALSRMEAVVLRPSFFMQVWLGPHLGFDVQQGKVRLYGDGRAPVSYISALDVASFAVAAATRGGELRETVDIGGPEPISQLEAAAIFERATGRRFEREYVPMAALEKQHRSVDPLQRTFAALMIAYALGDAMPDAAHVAQRYGVTLTSIEDYARQWRVQGDAASSDTK